MKYCEILISTNKDLGFFSNFLSKNIKNYYYLSSKIKSVIIKIDNYRDNITDQLKLDMNLIGIETEIFNGINGTLTGFKRPAEGTMRVLYSSKYRSIISILLFAYENPVVSKS